MLYVANKPEHTQFALGVRVIVMYFNKTFQSAHQSGCNVRGNGIALDPSIIRVLVCINQSNVPVVFSFCMNLCWTCFVVRAFYEQFSYINIIIWKKFFFHSLIEVSITVVILPMVATIHRDVVQVLSEVRGSFGAGANTTAPVLQALKSYTVWLWFWVSNSGALMMDW